MSTQNEAIEAFGHMQEKQLTAYLTVDLNNETTLAAVKGVLLAIANAPAIVPEEVWFPIALNTQQPSFDSEEQEAQIRLILSNLLESIRDDIASGQEVLPEECRAETIEASEFENLKAWADGYTRGSEFLSEVWRSIFKYQQIKVMEDDWSRCTVLINVWNRADVLLKKAAQPGGPDVNKMLKAMPAITRELAVMCYDIREIITDLLGKKPSVSVEKIGRNDPCPCGSGKKYKKCCGA